MRILIVSLGLHPDAQGGAWRVAAAQASGLAARHHTVDVVTARQHPDHPTLESRAGFALHRFPQTHRHAYANWRSENLAARELVSALVAAPGRPPLDLVVQHHAYLAPATSAIPESVPVLHVFHGPWAHEYRLSRSAAPRGFLRRGLDALVAATLHRVEARALRRARRILTLSRHFADHLATWHPGSLPPIEVAPGGVDFDRFAPLPEPDRQRIRRTFGLAPDDLLFVATRRLDPRMGLDVLIEAFARIAARRPRARLWLTGQGPAEAGLRSRIRCHRLDATVRLLGVLPESDLPLLLNAADVAVMPSLDLEGFGLATVEALACGTPVLGSQAGATPEILGSLDSSLLFPSADIETLARRLEEASEGPGKLPSRERCAAFARERYSWDHQLDACERAAALRSVP